MIYELFITFAVCAVSTTADSTATTTSDNSTALTSAPAGSTVPGSNSQTSPIPSISGKGAPTSTTPKLPITCNEGNCSGADCYNKTGFVGVSATCQSGESCAVLELSATNFSISCEPAAACKVLEALGTAACCETNSCTPADLAADLAKAKIKAKNNGCVSPRINVGFVLGITIALLMFN